MSSIVKEKSISILAGLLDDHNIALYALVVLAVLEPGLRAEVMAGILGYWTKAQKEKL